MTNQNEAQNCPKHENDVDSEIELIITEVNELENVKRQLEDLENTLTQTTKTLEQIFIIIVMYVIRHVNIIIKRNILKQSII